MRSRSTRPGNVELCIGALVIALVSGCAAPTPAESGRRRSGASTSAAPTGSWSPSSQSPARSAPPAISPSASRTSQGPRVPAPRAEDLTGFGAPVGVWRNLHREDAQYSPGSSYDSNRFGGVSESEGRIMGFDVNFAPRTSRAAVMRQVASLLPADARVAWARTLLECLVFQMQSATLARALFPRWSSSRGFLLVELNSVGSASGSDSFDESDVRAALFLDGTATREETTEC